MSVRKDFCSNGSFTYPVGTANGYSPVDSNITALGINPSSLTIGATQTVHPTLSATNSLKRYWTLTETGDLTTDLTFNYLEPTDISSAEATYKLYRVVGGMPLAVTPFTLNMSANTISATGISDFSDWAVGNVSPTAAVSIGGRVTTPEGNGLRNATVVLIDSNGQTRTARTGSFGFYRFEGIQSGQTVTMSVQSRGYHFKPRVLGVADNVCNVDFQALSGGVLSPRTVKQKK